MKIIVAVDNNWAIGRKGGLLFNIKEDMKFFRETTKDGVVVMGKNTFESLPNGPLPNRVNIVITQDETYERDDIIVVHSIEAAVEAASAYTDKETFCIGGGQVYKQMLKYCDTAYVTRIHASVPDADAFFVDMSKETDWYVAKTSELKHDKVNDITFRFFTYKKI